MQSRDPSTNVVLLEDAAAVLGVILAAGCMGLTSLTGTSPRHGCQPKPAGGTFTLQSGQSVGLSHGCTD